MIRPFDAFLKLENASRDRLIAIAFSVLIHIAIVVIVVGFSDFSPDIRRAPTVIDVDLMYVQAPPVKKKSKVQKSLNKKKRKVRKKTVKKKKKVLSLKKKKNTKKKKKVVKSKDIINDAINRLKKDLIDSKEDVVADRLKSLQKEAMDKKEESDDIIDTNTSVRSNGRTQLYGAQYSAYAIAAVQKNWAFSLSLAGSSKSLETWIKIKVRTDGEIIAEEIVKSSGNAYMDSTASMAVKRSSPLKPFPEGLKNKYIEIEIGFEPK